MLKNLLFILSALLLTACSHTYYVVRHAEKIINTDATTMAGDPPLTNEGQQRAEALSNELKDKHIRFIFSTNTVRTQSTAEPLRVYLGLTTAIYGPKPDSNFIRQLKSIKMNTLVIGHSNTVDDIVNSLCNAVKIPGDLKDDEYDNLFVVKYKQFFGTKVKFERRKYGVAAK
jgi:phosphohistidine phosphatase SixA